MARANQSMSYHALYSCLLIARSKAKPDLKKYRGTGFPLYGQLLILVENVAATGENAYRPGSRTKPKAAPTPESTDEYIDTVSYHFISSLGKLTEY